MVSFFFFFIPLLWFCNHICILDAFPFQWSLFLWIHTCNNGILQNFCKKRKWYPIYYTNRLFHLHFPKGLKDILGTTQSHLEKSFLNLAKKYIMRYNPGKKSTRSNNICYNFKLIFIVKTWAAYLGIHNVEIAWFFSHSYFM